MQAQDIIQFWFSELSNKQRFAKDPELDAAMRERFGPTLQAAISGDLASWRTSATGRLAEIVVLDQLTAGQQSFAYMPYMHSEVLSIHQQAVQLFSRPGLEDELVFELRHKTIIDRFGRFPHRNLILDRMSTPEEEAFLKQPGSSF